MVVPAKARVVANRSSPVPPLRRTDNGYTDHHVSDTNEQVGRTEPIGYVSLGHSPIANTRSIQCPRVIEFDLLGPGHANGELRISGRSDGVEEVPVGHAGEEE